MDKKEIEEAKKEKREPIKSWKLIQYGSQLLTLGDWVATYNLEHHRYKNIVSRENHLNQALNEYGLTEKQISLLISDRKYIKEIPKK